jgi:hypothetical protein
MQLTAAAGPVHRGMQYGVHKYRPSSSAGVEINPPLDLLVSGAGAASVTPQLLCCPMQPCGWDLHIPDTTGIHQLCARFAERQKGSMPTPCWLEPRCRCCWHHGSHKQNCLAGTACGRSSQAVDLAGVNAAAERAPVVVVGWYLGIGSGDVVGAGIGDRH